MVKVSIIGANGYTGLELLNILSSHGGVELVHVASRSYAGQSISSLFPSLTALKGNFCGVDLARIGEQSDVVFTALPHAAAAESAPALLEAGARVIDLSADFRYSSLSLYESVYKTEHPCPGLLKEAVYGLPELFRERIKGARLIGNPGCYTTSAIVPLYPLLNEGAISPDDIIVDSASGVSGAGRKADIDLSFCEVEGSFKAYGVTTHRHTSEIEEVLSIKSGQNIVLSFTPHLLPIKRGILSTIYCKPLVGEQEVMSIYEEYYGKERFVTVGGIPEIKHVAYSNNVAIGFKHDRRTNRLIVISAIDNLTKGAAGQAIQNMNLMFGLDEAEGLTDLNRAI